MNELYGHSYKFQFPQICKDYDEYKTLQQGLRNLGKAHKALLDKIRSDVDEKDLIADKVIAKVFEFSHEIKTSKTIVERARHRRDLREPPGKSDSIGDAVIWETLLEKVPNEEDLYFVTDDKDYQSPLNDEEPLRVLATEWKNKKKSDLCFYRKLSDFFKARYQHIRLRAEIEKEDLIKELIGSFTFDSTHKAIAKLNQYGSDFTSAQRNEIVQAALYNTQIRWIVDDWDVRGFLSQLIEGGEDEIDSKSLSELRELLDSQDSASEDVDNVSSDTEPPF